MKNDIFISFRTSDREFVATLAHRLEQRGVAAWYSAMIPMGENYQAEIIRALESSDMVLVVFSEDANNSKDIIKEITVADRLEKPVIPVFIEKTKPRGAYLYELASRNWIELFPEPLSRIEELVNHLVALAGKSPGGLDGVKPAAEPATEQAAPAGDAPSAEAVAAPSSVAAPAATAAPAPPAAEPRARAAKPAPAKKAKAGNAAPRDAQAYVGKRDAKGRPVKPLNDFLPFKWIDLVFLAPMVGGFAALMELGELDTGSDTLTSRLIAHVVIGLAIVGLYGALVFPFRYYLRRRPLWRAVRMYVLSSGFLYLASIGAFMIGWSFGLFPYDKPSELVPVFGVAWLVFTGIAFVIYAILGAQRAVRSFAANRKTL